MITTQGVCILFALSITAIKATSGETCEDRSGVNFCRNNCGSVGECREDERCARRCKGSCGLCHYFVSVDGSDSWDGARDGGLP